MRRRVSLSAAEARRIALAAQGFGERRPAATPRRLHVLRTVARLGLLQIDSVNVLVRAHYLPLFSRLGAYDRTLLDGVAYAGPRRTVFEYWGHEASLLPVALHPLLRWRMLRAERGLGLYNRLARFGRERRAFVQTVLREVTDRGQLAASDLSNGGRGRGSWWGWSEGKTALEWLFWAGLVTTAERRGFERVYDLPARALPPEVLAIPTPAEDVAQRALLRLSARAMGVATERDLRDYFRLEVADTRARLVEMVEAGDLLPVEVEGWPQPAYLHPEARIPRRIEARALLAPFDPLVWERQRTERLFDFHYRIGIYTPVEQRTHGYYVLPFLMDDRLVARVDLKADRAAGQLRVVAAHVEAGADARQIAPALLPELREMAAWLQLTRLDIRGRGGLGAALRACSLPGPGAPRRDRGTFLHKSG